MKAIEPTAILPAMIIACNVPENDYPDWLVSTAYVVGNTVLYNHKIYECLVDNTGFIPEDNTTGSPPKWLDLGYNNRWKMFDEKVGSQTSQTSPITITIEPGLSDTVSFLDLEATSIEITVTDPTDGVYYTDTIDLVSTSNVIDGYTYFFEPFILSDSEVLLDIPPYAAGSYAISIINTGGTAKIGTMAFGMKQDIGFTQYNATISIQDYSRKEVDSFGNYSILERSYAKKLSADVFLQNAYVDHVAKKLAKYRATPVIWVGVDSGFSSMVIYGFYRSFSISVQYVYDSICTLELEGLS